MVAEGGSSEMGQSMAAGMNGDSGVPAMDWQRGAAGELHEVKAKLTGALGWLGWRSSGGSAVDRRSPELEKRCGGVCVGDEIWPGLFIVQEGSG